jgi:hypothetical protein
MWFCYGLFLFVCCFFILIWNYSFLSHQNGLELKRDEEEENKYKN